MSYRRTRKSHIIWSNRLIGRDQAIQGRQHNCQARFSATARAHLNRGDRCRSVARVGFSAFFFPQLISATVSECGPASALETRNVAEGEPSPRSPSLRGCLPLGCVVLDSGSSLVLAKVTDPVCRSTAEVRHPASSQAGA